ncbi:MAG: flavodoxin [bacterium]
MRKLITFYSRPGNNYVNGDIVNLPVGNTEVAANMIHKLTDSDIFRIDTLKAYPEDYHETTEVAKQELRENVRPELSGHIDNMADYDVIYLGYPNWWGTMPMAVFTFLEAYDFAGKILFPFCTHEGSGMGRSESDIEKLCAGAKLLKGLAIRGGTIHEAQEVIGDWLRNLGEIV